MLAPLPLTPDILLSLYYIYQSSVFLICLYFHLYFAFLAAYPETGTSGGRVLRRNTKSSEQEVGKASKNVGLAEAWP